MELTWTLLAVIITTLAAAYKFFTCTYNYWDKHNVPCLPRPLPGIGHMWPVISLKYNITTFADEIYKNSKTSMVGFYFMRKPALVLCEPELIKTVTITNFSNFSANGIVLSEKSDPVLAKNPFFIADHQRWKASRARAIGSLSSKNLKALFDIVKDVGKNMNNFVDRKIRENNNGSFECELKEHFTRYTSEVVANCAFGVQGQSFEDNPDPLAFVSIAKKIFEPTFVNGIKQALAFYMPDIASFLNVAFIEKKTDTYFRENLKVIIDKRKKDKIAPNDFLQFCLQSNDDGDIDSIIADILIFYVDVYETSSTVLSILFYNLSQNQEVQEKLRSHIKSTIDTNQGKITYDTLKAMNYLDQVISESLRVMPPIFALKKTCTNEFTLKGSDGLNCRVVPGTVIMLPLMGLHNDSKYWKNPHVFDPDRFSPENQANIREGAYLPFGNGPRMCLGMRLGLMLVKLATATLLSNYSIQNSTMTKKPLEMEATTIITYAKGGFWGKFERL